MERFAALLAEGVHRFEGTVTQFTGEGVMALFGAPIAHEDHAQRACYAALRLGEGLLAGKCKLKKDAATCTAKGGTPTVDPLNTSCCSNTYPLTENACMASPSAAFLDAVAF